MWPTVDGLRVLRPAESDLICRAVNEMLDTLELDWDQRTEAQSYGITWFDQWDAEQRIWLLETVMSALLREDVGPLPDAAIHEATVDAIFRHIVEAIERELQHDDPIDPIDPSWRCQLLDAFRAQNGKAPAMDGDQTDGRRWRAVAGQVADTILGHPSYQHAEWLRDGEARQLEKYLQSRGLADDYLQHIPPLRDRKQTEASIKRLRSLVKRSSEP